jgi:hypothetical protein
MILFWVTTQVGATPALPSQKYASAWEQDSVLRRLLLRFNQHSTTFLLQDEREAKRHKGLDTGDYKANENEAISSALSTTISDPSDPSDPSLSGAIQATISNSPTSSWWESGDARKLFAPCSANYGATECEKAIVMDRIELLESVNRKGKNWGMEHGDMSLLRIRDIDVAIAKYVSGTGTSSVSTI